MEFPYDGGLSTVASGKCTSRQNPSPDAVLRTAVNEKSDEANRYPRRHLGDSARWPDGKGPPVLVCQPPLTSLLLRPRRHLPWNKFLRRRTFGIRIIWRRF